MVQLQNPISASSEKTILQVEQLGKFWGLKCRLMINETSEMTSAGPAAAAEEADGRRRGKLYHKATIY